MDKKPKLLDATLDDGGSNLICQTALFEGSFSIDWISELTGEKASRVLEHLEEGVDDGLLIKKAPGVFCFTDIEQRQNFLNKISIDEKKLIHRKIVEIFLQEPLDDNSKALRMAPHLLQINNDDTENRWLMRAGNVYRKGFQVEAALHCYDKIIKNLSGSHGREKDILFVDTAINYSKISVARHDTRKVLGILQEALIRARRWNSKNSEALLKMHLAKNEWLHSNYSAAFTHFKEGWTLVKDLNDSRLLRSATVFSTFFLFWQGRFREAIQTYESSVPDVEKHPGDRFPLLGSMTIGRCYAHLGQTNQGLGMLDSLRAYCIEKRDLHLGAFAFVTIGTMMLDIGRLDDAILYLELSMEEATKAHNEWVQILATLALAYAYHLHGKNEQSISKFRQFLKDSKKVEVTMASYPYIMEICWAMKEGHLANIPGVSIDGVIHQNITSENIYVKGIAYRLLAVLQRQNGIVYEKVINSLNLSLKWLEESGSQIELAKTKLELARLYLLMGNEEKAKELVRVSSMTLYPINPALIPDDLKSLTHDSSFRRDLLKEILNMAKDVVTIRDNRDLVHHIIATANRITGGERGAIFLIERNSPAFKIELRASKNLTSDQINDPSFGPSLKMIQEVAISGKGRIHGINSEKDAYLGTAIRSRICVPMILKDKVVGVLYHDNRLLGSAFRESDLELLAYFAAHAAFALDNSMAYEEINRLNQKLKAEKLYLEEEHLQNLHFDDIIGESRAIMNVLNQIGQVANTDATVLILGETGVGKELVARAIHRNSQLRCKGPFIRVFCSALPESLIPSELFGHEKGAFTGASQRRIGRFELADGGTLFLDEIGDLPKEVQVRLLRVLQTKEFERVGGNEIIRSDFRLIVATNRDLKKLVKDQNFRSDLYYRINVFPIYVPPLRDRKEDIPLLANEFLKNYATKMQKSFEGILESEMDKLTKYDWPGNVRELENIIERGIILSTDSNFLIPELGIDHQDPIHIRSGLSMKEMERHHILWALKKTGWKIRGRAGAAEILQIHPSTLAFRMKKLGIQRP